MARITSVRFLQKCHISIDLQPTTHLMNFTVFMLAYTEAAAGSILMQFISAVAWPGFAFTALFALKKELISLLSRLKTFKQGDTELSFAEQVAEVKRQTEDNAKQVNLVEDLVKVMTTQPSQQIAATRLQHDEKSPGPVKDDPWKGQFGGSARVGTRRLSADVEEILGKPGWFRLTMTVSSTDQGREPLTGEVIYYLHDSFPQPILHVPVGPDGTAHLQIPAWGAFTVGVIADGGKTELELDLAENPNFPEVFRKR